MKGWSLAELARFLGDCRVLGAETRVTGIALDSRRVEPGALFAALPGSRADGRHFVDEALARGAAALLLPAGSELPGDAPRLVCERAREAASRLAQHMAGDPSERLVLLGVTGSNGKSTCVLLLQALLGSDAAPWGALGTLHFDASGEALPSSHTTPDPVSLAALLARSVDAGRVGVSMEVSSHALDQDRVAGCRFAGVVMTNLSRDHLDYHGEMERYFRAKCRLLELRRPGAPALLNADDARLATLLASGRGDLASYGRAAGADYRIVAESLSADGSRFELATPQGRLVCRTRLPGEFNVSNAAACLGLALSLGADPEQLTARLAEFAGVPGRMESVDLPGGPRAIIDFAHSPDAVERVLAACRLLCRGKLRVLLGAGGDRDRGKRPLMGRAAQRLADVVYLTSDNPRGEDPAAILAEMEKGMDRSRGSWHKEVDRARAIRRALADCGEEDLLVLLGKGHERTQEIAGRFIPFNDRDELEQAWRESESGR